MTVSKIKRIREETDRVVEELHCDWFDLDNGIVIIKKALNAAERRGYECGREACEEVAKYFDDRSGCMECTDTMHILQRIRKLAEKKK